MNLLSHFVNQNFHLKIEEGAPPLPPIFFFTIKDDLMIESLLKEEMLSKFSKLFYGLHPYFFGLGRNKKQLNVLTDTSPNLFPGVVFINIFIL